MAFPGSKAKRVGWPDQQAQSWRWGDVVDFQRVPVGQRATALHTEPHTRDHGLPITSVHTLRCRHQGSWEGDVCAFDLGTEVIVSAFEALPVGQ